MAKFAAGVVNTGGKFASGVVDTGGNLPPVSLTTGKILACDARGPEFKSRMLCLLLFYDDILGSLGSNLGFIFPFGIT